MRTLFLAFATLAVMGSLPASAATVIHMGKVMQIEQTLADPINLWVGPEDLTRINGFVLKPEGLCRDEICIPLLQNQDSALFVNRENQKWINVTAFADKLQQAYAHDAESDTWSFGEVPPARDNFLRYAMAPDFELEDRSGNVVRLSDFRGKKVMLVTWASWCGCRLDVAAWQPIYEELKSKNFEIVSVAEDVGGEAAAGPILDEADVSYTALIDPQHVVSALYNFVNVPSAAWIDEEGRIVRINEGTYAKTHQLGNMTIGTDEYTPALRDWVENGAESRYVWTPEQVAQKIRRKAPDERTAEAFFNLGTYFYQAGNTGKAEQYWERAKVLYPDSWNMHRQEWSLMEPQMANRNWLQKQRESDTPYYAPLDL